MKNKPIDFKPEQILLDQIGNVPPGTQLELMTKFMVKPNGDWCIVSIEAVPMPGFDGEGNPAYVKGESMRGGDFVQKYSEAMEG